MTTIQTQTPALLGRTLTVRAAPSPDSLDGAGHKARPRTEDKGTFFVMFAVEEQNHKRMQHLHLRL